MTPKDAREGFWNKEYEKEMKGVTETIAAKKAVSIFRENGAIKILDVGCGIGQDSDYLSKNGFSVHGIDFSKTAIEKAKASVKKATFECVSVLEADMPKEGFDGIYCSKVLHQFKKKEIEEVTERVFNWLKKNGTAVITVISEESAHSEKGKEIEERTFIKDDGRMIHYFSEDEIRDVFARHGFHVTEVEKIEEFGRLTRRDLKHVFMFLSVKKE